MSKQQQKRKSSSMPSPTFIECLERRQLLTAILDLRVHGGGTSAVVSSVGQVVNLDIIATVSGTDANGANDGFQSGGGNLLSTNVEGGAALGTLSAAVSSPFDALGSENGKQQDLDADTDLDVGTNDETNNPNDSFNARAGSAQTSGGVVSGNSQTFVIGTATFTVTQLLGGTSTKLQITPKTSFTAGLWVEDGVGKSRLNNGIIVGGSGVTLTAPPSGMISGRVFNDTNGNGIFDGTDTGLAGYRVWIDKNHDGLFQKSREQYRYTSATGTYHLLGLPTSGYTVMTQAATGWRYTTANPQIVFATNGADTRGHNFGETTNVLIRGTVWHDSNKDKIIQSIESGLPGWTVWDDVDNDGRLDSNETSAVTDASGNFRFDTLAPGTHNIRVAVQSGYRPTTATVRQFTLGSGESIKTRFGMKRLA